MFITIPNRFTDLNRVQLQAEERCDETERHVRKLQKETDKLESKIDNLKF